jgi:hypothetical protein
VNLVLFLIEKSILHLVCGARVSVVPFFISLDLGIRSIELAMFETFSLLDAA